MVRPSFGRKGQPIELLTNHLGVNVSDGEDFFHYIMQVSPTYVDDSGDNGKGTRREVIDRIQLTYDTELVKKNFPYDEENSLFTVGSLPQEKLGLIDALGDISQYKTAVTGSPKVGSSPINGDWKRLNRPHQAKTFGVEISDDARIPMRAIASALCGQESEKSHEALRVVDLEENAAEQGCLLVRKSFFHYTPNLSDLGCGVQRCRGFNSSLRATQDVSATVFIQPEPVVDFLVVNQNVRDPNRIDCRKVKHTPKNLRITAGPSEMKITGLSELLCNRLDETVEDVQTTDLTIYDDFVNHHNLQLRFPGELPCINVGKPKRQSYNPLEVLASNKNDTDALLQATGVSISSKFTQIEGFLSAPKLKVSNVEDFFAQNGWQNFRHKRLHLTRASCYLSCSLVV